MDLPKKLSSFFYQLHWSIYTKNIFSFGNLIKELPWKKNILPLQKSLQITFSSNTTFWRELYFHKYIQLYFITSQSRISIFRIQTTVNCHRIKCNLSAKEHYNLFRFIFLFHVLEHESLEQSRFLRARWESRQSRNIRDAHSRVSSNPLSC